MADYQPIQQVGAPVRVSSQVARNAQRIYDAGMVRAIIDPRAFEVDGDNGQAYVVVVSDESISCTCRARVEVCKHVAAAGLELLEVRS